MAKRRRKEKPLPFPIHIGFTGSRWGMELPQRDIIRRLFGVLLRNNPCVFHHGDCKGADAQAHELANSFRFNGMSIIQHPPIRNNWRAFCRGGEIREPKDYIQRNRDIVRESAILIAGPWRNWEEDKGGTWRTVRRARMFGVPIAIVWPKGFASLEMTPLKKRLDGIRRPSQIAKVLFSFREEAGLELGATA